MTFVTALLLGTISYAATKIDGWGTSSQPRSLTNASCSRSTLKQARKPSDVTVNVYNSTPRQGFAGTVAKAVEKLGFNVAAIDNDPLGRTIPGLGEIRHGQKGLASSVLASTMLPRATVVQDGRTDTSVDLVLGKRFSHLNAPTRRELATAEKSLKRLRAQC